MYNKILLFLLVLRYHSQIVCETRFYEKDGSCLQCDSKCYMCVSSSLNCLSCPQGYFLQESSCLACSAICASCKTSLQCTSCVQGYFLQGSRCSSCTSNCAICNQTNQAITCTICKTGYDISTNCRLCVKAFYWNQTRKTCDRCALGCQQCISLAYCQACASGYTYQDGICNYNGNFEANNSQKSNDSTKIIVGVILGGIFAITATIYIASRVCLKKKKLKKKENPSMNHLKMTHSQSLDQQIPSGNIKSCSVCGSSNAQKGFDCGHFFHVGCLEEGEQFSCPLCAQKAQQKSVYLDQLMNNSPEVQSNSEINSQTTSQQPNNQAYLQSSMKQSSIVDNIIQIEDDD